ncbi:hypothetical protein Cgig2_029030 [Carnegiea gigantea]|uniref:Uncharacterized protein n=1 Tax=Carnegiea gigantea TaxID=171969 RepID=A0A9Q1Q786_9CARY|nr:hypothetical protein Cgig2_029030 [Carnegiea gigantea]
MAEMVIQNWASFKWDKLHEAMPLLAPNLLPANLQLICLDYISKDAKEVTQEFEIPEIVQVIYYAMVVANTAKLAFSQRSWATHKLLFARQKANMAKTITNPHRLLLQLPRMHPRRVFGQVGPRSHLATYMFGKNSRGGRWIMRYLCLLLLLPIHYRRIIKTICPDFVKEDAKNVGRDFHILEIVQVMFYAMIVNEAIELNDLPQIVAGTLKDSLVNLNWYSFESKLSRYKRLLLPT